MPEGSFGRRGGRWALVASLALLAVAPAAAAQVPGEGVGGEAPTFKAPPEGRLAPSGVIVKYKEGARFSAQGEIRRQEGLRKEGDLGLIGAEVAEPQGRSAEAAARDLEARPDVEYAVPDRPLYRFGYSDEPRFGELWGLNNVGQAVTSGEIPGGPGTPDVDVNALEASSITEGNEGVTVAVIDDGVDFSHPDLAGQEWANPGESGGGKETNEVDDDRNGYVDDVNGWDFYNGDGTTHDELEDAHGTHVAGTIAAAEDGEGVVGVAPGVDIMALKFLGPMGGTTSDAILAIEYAKAKGAKVINASWGCTGCPEEEVAPLEQAIEASGLLFVAAAGNSGADNDNPDPNRRAYPASFDSPNIVSVAAAENTGQMAFFSNYGATTVDISAPGLNVLSSIPGTPDLPAATLSTVGDAFAAVEGMPLGGGKALVSGFGMEEISRLADREAFVKSALSAVGRTEEPVVLVDDDMSDASEEVDIYDVRLPLRNAIEEATGQRPEVIDVLRGDGPSLEALRGKVVVWSTGWAFGSDPVDARSTEPPTPNLTPVEQEVLTEFLEDDGKLIVSGMDATGRIEETPFVKETLGISVQPENMTFGFGGSPGTAFDGASYPFGGPYLFPFTHDVISPAPGSLTEQQGVYPGSPDGWEYYSGTSMAAPHVTGVAALVASAKPDLAGRPAALKDVLLKSAKPLPATEGLTATGGMVDARAALAHSPPAEPSSDNVAPSVTRVSPAAGARRVAPAANVAARFSERMNVGTLDHSTFTLVRKGTSTKIAATVTYNPSTNVATLNPKSNLRRGAAYRATVTTGARDLSGNPLAANRTWTFTVRP